MDEYKGYDIIGDIHGCAYTLKKLLEKLGYRKRRGIYHHQSRQAIFVGDIIDRGPHIREALSIVYEMVEAGFAQIVMGNHEYNALCYCTRSSINNGYLRPHTPHHQRLISETLEQFENHQAEWRSYIDWFANIPLFLETEHFRVVHACWDQELIDEYLESYGTNRLLPELLEESADWSSKIGITIDVLLRGTELMLPDKLKIVSRDGHQRTFFRTKFWAKDPVTYGDVAYQPDPLSEALVNRALTDDEKSQLLYYPETSKPLFFGHYWLQGKPKPIQSNLACLDYSAVKFGRLVAYRMDNEVRLSPNKFVWEYVDSPDFPS